MKIPSIPLKILFLASVITLFAAKLTAQVTFTKNTASLIAQDSVETTGARFADYDNDGDLDLYLANPFPAGSRNRLYQNNCDEFEFTRVIAIPEDIVSVPGFGEVLWVDVDNDGDMDIFVTIGGNNKLYENNGDGTFTRITTGIIVNDPHFSRQAGWADINNDGVLDLFTGNNGGIGENNSLYRNNGDGTFTLVVSGAIVNDGGNSNALAWGDYDNDGDMDLFVGNRNTFNFLYRNDGDTVFTKITGDDIVTKNPFENLVAHWIDYDNDGDLDIYSVRGFGAPVNSLFDNNGNGTFTLNTTAGSIVTDNETSISQSWGDLDNDGDLDCIVGNISANSYYNNNGDGTFTKITTGIIGNDVPNEANDTRIEDINRDGFLDVYVSNSGINPTNFLYVNDGNANHWINIRLIGVTSNRSAVGARIFVKATISGSPVRQMREVTNQSASNSPNNHIGLGDATAIDTLTIVWPASGTTQVFTNVAVDRFIEITEGVNVIVDATPCITDFPPVNPGFITGTVFVDDVVENCSVDAGEDGILGRLIKATDQNNKSFFAFTDKNGLYTLFVKAGLYAVTLVSSDITQEPAACGTGVVHNVTVLAGDTVSGNDFFVVPICAGDVGIVPSFPCEPSSCPLRPIPECCDTVNDFSNRSGSCKGCRTIFCFTYNNTGTLPMPPVDNSSFDINLDGLGTPYTNFTIISNTCEIQEFTSTVNPGAPPSLSWSLDQAFKAGDACEICISVEVGGNCPAGGKYFHQGVLNASCIGQPIPPPSQEFEDNCTCPCDPNDKLTRPEGCGPSGNIGQGESITYTVRFQNVGGSPARDVLIRDELDEHFNLSSVRILDTSDSITSVEIIPEGVLVIRLDSINLPDSASDPVGSRGFVVFGVSLNDNLSDGTEIRNQAAIYFDQNQAVITNSVLNTVRDDPFPVADFDVRHSCSSTGLVFDFFYTGGTSDAATFEWDFGPSASPPTSTDENPSGIVYSGTGLKDVTLIITRFGCTDSFTQTISVEELACADKKTLICHIPAGNPESQTELCVSDNGVQAHLSHGDCLGPCSVIVPSSASRKADAEVNDPGETIPFEVFPNPNNGEFTITGNMDTGESFEIEVYDALGKVVFRKGITGRTLNLTIDLRGNRKGIYYVRITGNSKSSVREINYQ